jgi:hypothetical protein
MPTRVGEVQPRDIVCAHGKCELHQRRGCWKPKVCLFLHMLDLVVFHDVVNSYLESVRLTYTLGQIIVLFYVFSTHYSWYNILLHVLPISRSTSITANVELLGYFILVIK